MMSLGANRSLVNRAGPSRPCLVSVPRVRQPMSFNARAVAPIAAATKAADATEKKTRKSPKAADPQQPKKAPSAWVLFVAEGLKQHKASLPAGEKAKVAPELKVLGGKWSKMTDAQKKPYLDKAAALKSVADEAIQKYKASQPPVVKGPIPAYSAFVKENYPDVKAKNPSLEFVALQKVLAKRWAALPEDEKKRRTAEFNKANAEHIAKHGKPASTTKKSDPTKAAAPPAAAAAAPPSAAKPAAAKPAAKPAAPAAKPASKPAPKTAPKKA